MTANLHKQLDQIEQDIKKQQAVVALSYHDLVTGDHAPSEEDLAQYDTKVNALNALVVKRKMIKEVLNANK